RIRAILPRLRWVPHPLRLWPGSRQYQPLGQVGTLLAGDLEHRFEAVLAASQRIELVGQLALRQQRRKTAQRRVPRAGDDRNESSARRAEAGEIAVIAVEHRRSQTARLFAGVDAPPYRIDQFVIAFADLNGGAGKGRVLQQAQPADQSDI